MTIAAAYLVTEGIVFGADSSTTVQVSTPSGPAVAQLLTHSQKVFEVGTNSRFGVCTWGAGSLGDISHRTAIAQLAEKIKDDTTVQVAAEEFVKIIEPKVKAAHIDFVGYYLGGWDPNTHMPACFFIEVKKTGSNVSPMKSGLCSFSGNASFFTRVFRGYDPNLPETLKAAIKNSLPPENQKDFDGIFDKAFANVTAPLITAGFQDLPIREAIDFIYSYLHITVKAEKFKYGAPSCGGPIEVGFISSDRMFRWVCHKPFSSAIIAQEGDYDI